MRKNIQPSIHFVTEDFTLKLLKKHKKKKFYVIVFYLRVACGTEKEKILRLPLYPLNI